MQRILVVAFLAVGSISAQPLATVYVSAPLKDGFVDTDKEIEDSVRDVGRQLAGMKEFRIVENAETADLVVTILTRGVGSQTYGQRVTYSEHTGQYYTNAQLTNTPMVAQTLWVSAVMQIGTHRKEFTGTALNVPGVRWGRWTECATNLAKNLRAWASANREQIKRLRPAGPR